MKLKLLLPLLCISTFAFAQQSYLFIGTYTGTGSKGIYVYSFNTTTGKAQWVSNTDSMVNPSYLTISTNRKYLYAVSESGGKHPGKINAFSFNQKTGHLTFLNAQSSGGDNPCYVSVTKNGKWVAVGNYTGGNLSMFKTTSNGTLNPAAQLIQHTGNGANAVRQEKAHVHSTVFSPNEKQLLVPDLGLDKIMLYDFNSKARIPLKPSKDSFATTLSGSGPRHFVFSPNARYGYLIKEMGGAINGYIYEDKKLYNIQNIATHPEDFSDQPGSADIHISPDGKFLYASNRGSENNIAIYSIEPLNGLLNLIGYQSTLGISPRNFCIDPTGNFLIVANQLSDNIVIFKRSKDTGLLTATGDEIKIPKPVCLQMF